MLQLLHAVTNESEFGQANSVNAPRKATRRLYRYVPYEISTAAN